MLGVVAAAGTYRSRQRGVGRLIVVHLWETLLEKLAEWQVRASWGQTAHQHPHSKYLLQTWRAKSRKKVQGHRRRGEILCDIDSRFDGRTTYFNMDVLLLQQAVPIMSNCHCSFLLSVRRVRRLWSPLICRCCVKFWCVGIS